MSRRREHGFSLLEVMVAISVLSVVVLAVSLIPALGLGRNNDTRTYAVNVAREVLDVYRSLWQERDKFRDATEPLDVPTGLRFGCNLQTSMVPYSIDSKNFNLVTPTVDAVKVRQVTVVIDCPKAGQTSLSTYIGDPNPAGP